MTSRSPFGRELHHWRERRGLSQLQLAVAAETTSRHISFLETGRSRPSGAMVERLCETLGIPLRERNLLFEAAGLAGRYPAGDLLGDERLAPFAHAVSSMLERHLPYPAFAVDHRWDVIAANVTADVLIGSGDRNIARLMFSEKWGALIDNWQAVAWAAFGRLRLDAASRPHDDRLAALVEMGRESLTGVPRPTQSDDDLVVCPHFRLGDVIVPTVGVTAHFDTPRNVTIDEVRIELIFPETPQGHDVFSAICSTVRTAS